MRAWCSSSCHCAAVNGVHIDGGGGTLMFFGRERRRKRVESEREKEKEREKSALEERVRERRGEEEEKELRHGLVCGWWRFALQVT